MLGYGAEPWRYTDDGEMMIAVGESLVRMGGVSATDLLSTLASSYDPARGYGNGMKLALAAFKRGRRAGTASWEKGSKGNGGAVRGVPSRAPIITTSICSRRLPRTRRGQRTRTHSVGRGRRHTRSRSQACSDIEAIGTVLLP
jgi:hypothetical protein